MGNWDNDNRNGWDRAAVQVNEITKWTGPARTNWGNCDGGWRSYPGDAWDDAKRSREYLNARDTDLDARYFAHAARDKVKGHVSVVRSSDISRG